MPTVSLAEAQATLEEIIHRLRPGEEVIITENQQPVAKLIGGPTPPTPPSRPGPGLCRGMITYMAPDFDAPLEQPRPVPGRGKGMLTIRTEDDDDLEAFQEYMP